MDFNQLYDRRQGHRRRGILFLISLFLPWWALETRLRLGSTTGWTTS